MSFSRRRFLQVGLSSLAYFTIEQTTPNWIIRSAHALPPDECLAEDRILVIVQLAGGNDGLNTIIPSTDAAYYGLRPNLGIQRAEAITLDSLNSLHPAMQSLASWYQDGQFATIQNVGYVNPNLSHFTSTEYFEEGYVPGENRPRQGWASKMYDNACGCKLPDPAIFYLGSGVRRSPGTLTGSDCYTPPAVRDAANYRLVADADEALRLQTIEALNNVATLDPQVDFLQRSENALEASIDDIAVADQISPIGGDGAFSDDGLGRGLKLASQVIRAGFKTRIFYVSQGGYDTHANQVIGGSPTELGQHPRLLGNLSRNLDSFLMEMKLSGNLDRVLLMTFSEFGRRVEENSSMGTDHGAANSMMLLGGQVTGGIYGGQPDLGDLQRGNLKHKVDFRTVYAKVIEDWLGCDATGIFGPTTYSDIITPGFDDIPFLVAPAGVKASTFSAYQ